MKILCKVRRAFAIIGYLADEKIFVFKYCHTLVSCLFMLILTLFEASSTIYLVRHLKIGDYINSVYAGAQMMAVLPRIVSFGAMMYHKDKVRDTIDGFQGISDNCEGKASANAFERADRLSEKCLSFASAILIGGFAISSIVFAAITCVYYYIEDGHIDFGRIYLPLKTSLPFNQNTCFGWIAAFCLHVGAGSTYLSASIATATFFLATGFNFKASRYHFLTIMSDENGRKPTALVAKKSLIQAVDFHRSTRSIFAKSQASMSATILIELFVGMLYISSIYSCLETAASNLDLSFVVWMIGLPMSVGTVFLYCYVGSSTTSQFLRYGDITYMSNWLELPIELQKCIHVLIANTQRPLIYNGLNLIDLNLMTFAKIAKTAITYYMMFRRLAK